MTGPRFALALSCLVTAAFIGGDKGVSAIFILTSVHPESGAYPRAGDSVTLRCEVLDFNDQDQFVSWSSMIADEGQVLTWEGAMYEKLTDSRYSMTQDITSHNAIQELLINPAQPEHSGLYTCRVWTKQAWNNVKAGEQDVPLVVYPAEVFPTCSPDGAAAVDEGDPLTCAVQSDDATLEVSRADGVAREGWALDDAGAGTTGTASATPADDGATFNCSSHPIVTPDVSLTCSIGPLTVTPSSAPTTPAPLSPTADPDGDAKIPEKTPGDPIKPPAPTTEPSGPAVSSDPGASPARDAAVASSSYTTTTEPPADESPVSAGTFKAVTVILVLLVIAAFLTAAVVVILCRRRWRQSRHRHCRHHRHHHQRRETEVDAKSCQTEAHEEDETAPSTLKAKGDYIQLQT